MPVEIRELVIRAVATSEGPGSDLEGSPNLSGGADEQSAIVQECVRQVMRILRKEKGR